MNMSIYGLAPEPIEAKASTEPLISNARPGMVQPIFGSVFETFNPVELLGEIISDAEAGLVLLAIIVGVVMIAFVFCGLWSVVQEMFSSGGPPQGLGLR
jgi:hypothetical protein